MRSKLSKKTIISIQYIEVELNYCIYAIINDLSIRILYEINAPFKDIE